MTYLYFITVIYFFIGSFVQYELVKQYYNDLNKLPTSTTVFLFGLYWPIALLLSFVLLKNNKK